MNKDFNFNVLLGSELIVSKSSDEAKPKYVVRSVASSVNEDRQGERLSALALKKMQDTASLDKIPIFSEHQHSWKNTMGFIENSTIKDNDSWIIDTNLESPEFNEDSALLINKMDHGTPISMSIGGRVLKSHLDKSGDSSVRVIDDLELFEVSFVGIPANKDASVISYIAKSFDNMEEDTMTEKIKKDEETIVEEAVVEEPKAEETVEAEPVEEEAVKSYVTKKDLEVLKSELIADISVQLAELKATKKSIAENTEKDADVDEVVAVKKDADAELRTALAKRIGLEE